MPDTTNILTCLIGHAIPQVASRWLPTAVAQVSAQVWFSPFTSVPLANSHSTNCSTLIIYQPRLVQ
jgi:hypothetical protein